MDNKSPISRLLKFYAVRKSPGRSVRAPPRKSVTAGIDLAKNAFAAHRVDDRGKAVLDKPKVSREQVKWASEECLVGKEPGL